jgi:hypothetical protein
VALASKETDCLGTTPDICEKLDLRDKAVTAYGAALMLDPHPQSWDEEVTPCVSGSLARGPSSTPKIRFHTASVDLGGTARMAGLPPHWCKMHRSDLGLPSTRLSLAMQNLRYSYQSRAIDVICLF